MEKRTNVGKKITHNTECIYALIDWNGEIRMLNITHNCMWKQTIKSGKYRGNMQHKVQQLPYKAMAELVGKKAVDQFEEIDIKIFNYARH